ncbi:lipid-A-disaccharide synthase-related protein [Deinococcus altitudinis]|uniref:lipid-A-disaccharide synthase-related protein n=1 Tax=Deinococcus altitudinis TaxID=468914 RepID=UPI003891C3B8
MNRSPLTDPPTTGRVLIVSNGGAEDLIGAGLGRELLRRAGERSTDLEVLALPLVGAGAAYGGVARLAGPALHLPSGGFPFGSLSNLRADLKAGLIGTSLSQGRAAWQAGGQVNVVVVVGDSFALTVGTLAARQVAYTGLRLPLVHLQPLVSRLYGEGMGVQDHLRELNALGANAFMPWEIALGRRARRVYTRDAASARYLALRGVNAVYRGSFAMDVLPAPERALDAYHDGRPLLVLMPGGRGDARESLPVMLEAAARRPEMQAVVAWPRTWADLPELPGWTLEVLNEDTARLRGDGPPVWLLRGAFSALLREAQRSHGLALGTAGTASEQAAGLGVPVVGFPTSGPQYTAGFARRQARLLGRALTLTAPDAQAVATALEKFNMQPEFYRAAAQEGQKRIGTAGALPEIAAELLKG